MEVRKPELSEDTDILLVQIQYKKLKDTGILYIKDENTMWVQINKDQFNVDPVIKNLIDDIGMYPYSYCKQGILAIYNILQELII